MSNKIERINSLLHNLKPDLVILTEHGQNKEALRNTRLTGYSLSAAFCKESHLKGGGVAIFAKNSLKDYIETVDTHEYCEELVCEIAIAKIKLGKLHMFLVGVYRTKENLETSLEVISEALEDIPTNKPVLIMGDLNIDSLAKKKDYTLLNEILTSYNIQRLNLPATRITPTSKTSIDCVCTNLQLEKVHVEVIETAISDHTGQLCTIQWEYTLPPTPTVERRNMSNKNINLLKTTLSMESWTKVYEPRDVEESYNNFTTTLSYAINLTCPIVKQKRKIRQNKQTLNSPIVFQLRRQFIEAQDLYNTTGNHDDKRRAAELKKRYDLHLKYLRRQDHIAAVAEADNKSKVLWQLINSERKTKGEKSLPEELNIQGVHTKDPVKIVDHLNTFFTNIAEETILNNPTNEQRIVPDSNPHTPNFTLKPTNIQEMDLLIRSLKTKTSAGHDCISTKLLKTCKEELIGPLVDITNKSFRTGIFPSALKLATVYPKFKQGCTTQAANYRPISLIPTFSKVIEKLVLNRLLNHLSLNQLLTTQQHGFLTGKSTTTALIALVEFLIDQLEEGNTTTAIMLDYSKAFDCLSHEHLLVKLTTLGIRGPSLDWFKSYLTGRSQVVEISHTSNGLTRQIKSVPQTINRGVPQGSVLGPVLFILFTNDFPRYMQNYCNSLMYADDTVLLLGNKIPEQLDIAAYTALNMAIQYCQGNDLIINQSKTKQLVLGRNREISGRLPDLEETTTSKYLGVIIDDHLTWTCHIDSLCKKLSTALYVIRRMKNISDTVTARTAYFALYESQLRYGIATWGGTSAGNLQRLLIHQKKAIRILGNLQSRESCRQTFKELKILTVVNLYILESVTFLHTKSPHSARTGAQNHNYHTRHAPNYQLPIHHLSATEKKPSYAGAKLWNTLPEKLKKIDNLHFGRQLKLWLQEHPLYSLLEFYQRTDSDSNTS